MTPKQILKQENAIYKNLHSDLRNLQGNETIESAAIVDNKITRLLIVCHHRLSELKRGVKFLN